MIQVRSRTDFIVIHCSATPPGSDIGADEIRDWHTAPPPRGRGWDDIGYHAVIRRDGTVEWGRPFGAPGAHVRGQNYRSVGLCLVGGVDHDGAPECNFEPEQKDALLVLLGVMRFAYPAAKVLGHRDLSPDLDGDGIVERGEFLKACPSFDYAFFRETGRMVLWG